MLMTDLDKEDPGHLLNLIVHHFSPADTLISNFTYD